MISMDQRLLGSVWCAYRVQRYNISRGRWPSLANSPKKNLYFQLELGREVDAVVLTDVADGLWRELLGFGTDAHGVEDVTARLEVTTESAG